jgi:hypothetical protein
MTSRRGSFEVDAVTGDCPKQKETGVVWLTTHSGRPRLHVGFERTHVSVDGGPMRDMVIRVTHIYRRIHGEWKLVHRHADFPPPDQRTTSGR